MKSSIGIWLAAFLASFSLAAEPRLVLPLGGSVKPSVGTAEVSASGPHRFVKIGGRIGYQPLSLESHLKIKTDAHRGGAGSIVVWVSPLESLDSTVSLRAYLDQDPLAKVYNLMADALPVRDRSRGVFSWAWTSTWNPAMQARFHREGVNWDLAPAPWAFIEHIPLEQKQWHQFVLAWDKPEHRIRIYVNGILAGNNQQQFTIEKPGPELYLGNPAMAFSGLEIHERELKPEDVARLFQQSGRPADPVQRHLANLYTAQPKPKSAWKPTAGWDLAYSASFTKEADLQGWIQQGCLQDGYQMKEYRVTPDGLLLETPTEIGNESRVYLWSPRAFEGDVAVEFEFRPERDTGLALVVTQASGMQREDFITDHPKRTTGSMSTIINDRVRNYHWEFFRSYKFHIDHVSTQVMAKNPWERALGFSSIPKLEIGKFHRLQYIQEGRRLRAVINGETVLEAEDDPNLNLGPVYDFGRIGLRLMYDTRMTFRNMKVWNRNTGVQVVQ